MDDRQTYINTRLNRCASYRCDGVVFFMNAKSPCQIRKSVRFSQDDDKKR